MGICICCCCNKKNTDCVENTLIVFNSIEIFFLILGLILIEWKIASNICLAINLIIFLLLICCLAIVVIFKCFREYETIYTKYRKLSYILAYLGMSFSLVCIFLTIISESLISEKIYQYDHPCLYRLSNTNTTNRLLTISNKTKVDNDTIIKDICDNNITDSKDVDSIFWYNKRSAPKDIVMSYICSSIIEVLSLIGAFFWYNDVRRIKYCIKNKMSENKGLIKYGPLGGYLGYNKGEYTNNVNNTNNQGKINDENNNKNEEIITMKINNGKNMSLNLNLKNNNKNNISQNNSSYNRNENIKITERNINYAEDGEIINNKKISNNESHITEKKEDKKDSFNSFNSDFFY